MDELDKSIIENLIKRCENCNLKECIGCNVYYKQVEVIKVLYDIYKNIESEENK